MAKSFVTPEMKAIVGRTMRESVSYPVSASDIRKWALAVYYPEVPPRRFWDETHAATLPEGFIAPEDFNPFAWITVKPAADEPHVAQTAFSERELGIEPPATKAILLTEIRARHGEVPIRPGHVITSTVAITDYCEREGRMGLMLYTTLSNTFTNQDGAWLRTVDSVFVRY